MALRLRYGSYVHAYGEPEVAISRRTIETDGGTPYKEHVNWQISGVLRGTDPASTLAMISALEAAYSRNNNDLVLYDDSTGVVWHALYNSRSVNGIHVMSRPSYPKSDGVEMVVDRTYQISVEAEFYTSSSGNVLKAFHEQLSFSGGGPILGIIEPINRPAIYVLEKKASAYRVEQSGSAMGMTGFPPQPIILWPGAVIGTPTITPSGPRYSNGKYTEFGLSWSIRYAAPVPLVGNPTVRPTG